MASPFQLNRLILRKPSLRGHLISERQRSGSGFSVFSAIERSTHLPRVIYQVKNLTSSVAAIAAMLNDSGVEFEAKRLRNGNLCFVTDSNHQVADSNHQVAVAKTTQESLMRRVKRFKLLNRPLILFGLVGVGILAVAVLSGGNNEPLPPVIVPSTVAIECDQQFFSRDEELSGFLEGSLNSSIVEFNVVSSQEIGGLRSVELVASCKRDATGGELSKDTQRWRATLGKSKNKWAVIKMIRLDN